MKALIFLIMLVPVVHPQTTGALRPLPKSLDDWQRLMPAVREALDRQFGEEQVRGPYGTRILRASHVADITGDGIPEAMVFFGIPGASTSQLTLVRIENGKPVVALFKDQAGKTGPMVWAEGASVMHGDSVDLLPGEHAVFAFHHNYGADGKLQHCGGEAYAWKAQSRTFHYNPALTKKLTEASCRLVPKTVE